MEDYTRTVVIPGTSNTQATNAIVHTANWTTGVLQLRPPLTFNSYQKDSGFSDVETPGWRTLIAQGHILNKPYEKWVNTIDITGSEEVVGDFGPYAGWMRSYVTGKDVCWAPPTTTVPDHPTDIQDYVDALTNTAVTKAWSRVNDASLELLTSLGEGKETINYLVHLGFRLVRILRAAKKLDLKQLKNEITPMDYANEYLELRYAARPLIGEAKGAIKAFNRKFDIPRVTRGWRAEEVIPPVILPPVRVSNMVFYNSMFGTYMKKEVTTRSKVVVGCGVMFQITSDQVYNLGLDQIIQAGYELTWLSFMVDWFINLGDFIGSWAPKFSIRELASWITVVRETTTDTIWSDDSDINEIRCQAFVNQAGYCNNWFMSPSIVRATRLDKTRVPNPNKPKLPSVDINLDILKILDMTLILKGLAGRR